MTSENGSRLARELAVQTPATEYDAVAERYERLVAPRFAVVAARLANIAALRPGERVLELGAGTGALSRLIAPRLEPDGHLVLLDVSSRMLHVAARVLRKAGSRNVTCVSHDMSALPCADGDFDMVLSHMGYFEESQKAAREEILFRRFKAEESSQSITAVRRLISPEDNNERQQIHDHASVLLEGAGQ